jgi:hypothetical protein
MDSATHQAIISGYAMLLPAGWRRIPVMHGTSRAIAGLLDEVFFRLGGASPVSDLQPYRIQLERHLTDMVRGARRRAAVDLYLPIEQVHGTAVPASIVVSRGTFGVNGLTYRGETAQRLATGSPEASPVSIDGVEGVRFERSANPDLENGLPCGSRLVDYLFPIPGLESDWLVIAFSVLDNETAAEEFSQLQVELFDAMLSTFRWINR